MEEKQTVYAVEPTDLPREKLARGGAETLSDLELLAVMLGSGCAGKPVQELARDALLYLDTDRRGLTASPIKGLGKAKLSLLQASREFYRRRYAPRNFKISGPEQVYQLLRYHAAREQEHFFVLTLNGANETINIHTVSVGLVNRTVVHPREVFRRAVADNACSVILAHNHPSGNLQPSSEDLEVTRRLTEAGAILGIPVLDHLIVSVRGYLSLQQEGEMVSRPR